MLVYLRDGCAPILRIEHKAVVVVVVVVVVVKNTCLFFFFFFFTCFVLFCLCFGLFFVLFCFVLFCFVFCFCFVLGGLLFFFFLFGGGGVILCLVCFALLFFTLLWWKGVVSISWFLGCETPWQHAKSYNTTAFKGENRDFDHLLTSPRTVSNTHAQVARAQSCANHVQHIELLSRATCRVPRGTMGQLSCQDWQS